MKKTIFVVIYTILLVCCLGIDGWFIGLKLFAPKKQVDSTILIGNHTLSNGTKEAVIKVKHSTNNDKNGTETLDIQLTTVLYEGSDDLYTYGMQFVAKNGNGIGFDYSLGKYGSRVERIKNGIYTKKIQHYLSSFVPNSNTDVYYYYGLNGSLVRTNDSIVNKDIELKIQTEDNIYKLAFKQNDKLLSPYYGDMYLDASLDKPFWHSRTYIQGDPMYLAYVIHQAIKGLAAGTSHSQVLEFNDVFELYEYNSENKSYYSTAVKDTALVESIVHNYLAIDVDITASGVTKSSDSLHGWFAGNQAYNSTGTPDLVDYAYGKGILNVTEKNCRLVATDVEGEFILRLKDSYVKDNLQYKDICVINAKFDLNEYTSMGITIVGFDSQGFEVWQNSLGVA